jgi:hypothetical protein
MQTPVGSLLPVCFLALAQLAWTLPVMAQRLLISNGRRCTRAFRTPPACRRPDGDASNIHEGEDP